jgi:hypothetical protein
MLKMLVQTETVDHWPNPKIMPAANPAPILPSEPNLANPRKIPSSLPPAAARVPAAPVASFPIETRT